MLITHSDLPEDPSLIHSIYVGWLPKVSNSSSRGSSFLFHLSLSLKTTFLRYNLHITMFTLLNAQFNDFFFFKKTLLQLLRRLCSYFIWN